MAVSVALLVIVVVASLEVYNIFRKKYEVLGVVIDPVHGGMTAKSEKFRTMKEAQKCYADCKSQFATVCIIER